jgi:hypothetical protein
MMVGNGSPRFEGEGTAPDAMRWDMNPSRKNASKKAGPVDGNDAPCPGIEFASGNGSDGSETEELDAASGAGIVSAREGAD